MEIVLPGIYTPQKIDVTMERKKFEENIYQRIFHI